jgi:hypothetical protein
MEWKTISKIRVYLSDEVKYVLGNQGGFMEEIMEESRRVVYGKVTDKSVGTEVSTIQVMHGGRYMICRPSNIFNKRVTQLVSGDEKIEENDNVVQL